MFLMYKRLVTIFILAITTLHTQAQETKKETDTTIEKSYFKVEGNFISNAVYLGRKDSAITPYFTPSIGYYHKSGFFINASLSFLTTQSRIDVSTITAGYNFMLGESFGAGVYAEKYFYNGSSTNVQAETKGTVGVSANYDIANIISINGGVDLLFSNNTDIITTLGLGHSIYAGTDAKQFTFTPSISLNAGTQKFYGAIRKSKRRPRPNQNPNFINNIKVNGDDEFRLLNYEFSLPINYDTNKWGAYFTPYYALPQNPVSITGPGGNTFNIEKLENVFYAEVGIYFKF